MIKKLSIYYLLFILAFSWGLLVGYKKIFPYKILRSIAQETFDFYKGEKNIKDGFTYVLDTNGNVMKDSLGNDIKVDKIVKISAKKIEFEQTKSANPKPNNQVVKACADKKVRQ